MSTVSTRTASRTPKTKNARPASSPDLWTKEINVRDFIQQNYEPYYGDEAFLAGPTKRTKAIWKKLTDLFVEERKKGVLDVSQIPSSITAHDAGYIDKDNEVIVGLQTDAPLKRAIMPNGGLRMVLNALEAYRLRARPGGRRDLHQISQDPQRRRVRRLYRGRPPLPQLAHPDRPARRLWPRPDHRRLSPRRALRRRPADRAQEGGESRARRRMVDRRDHPRPRGAEPSRSARSANSRKWRPNMASTSRGRRRPPRKPCNGSISAISPG